MSSAIRIAGPAVQRIQCSAPILLACRLISIGFTWMQNGSFSMEPALEFLATGKPAREVQRHCPDEVKTRIVSESLRLGTTVNKVV